MKERDPVCGMSVDSESAPADLQYAGEHYYFCSTTCRNRFETSPAQYLAGGRRGEEDVEFEKHEPPRTMKDGVVSPKFGSSTSGGGEFDPVPERHED